MCLNILPPFPLVDSRGGGASMMRPSLILIFFVFMQFGGGEFSKIIGGRPTFMIGAPCSGKSWILDPQQMWEQLITRVSGVVVREANVAPRLSVGRTAEPVTPIVTERPLSLSDKIKLCWTVQNCRSPS